MIGHIEGQVLALTPGGAIVNVGGVGYKVAATKDTLAQLTMGGAAALWTHLAVRENALDLYGFPRLDELRFFELLLTVSGIGPKSALAILDIATVETLRNAIAQGNAGYLTSVSGIGRKTAEKIVLELRDKVGVAADDAPGLQGESEALEALLALGYTQVEARNALRNVPASISGGNERLREALRIMGAK